MILKKLEVSINRDFKTNCYIIADEITKEAIVVDPAGEVNRIIEMLDVLNVNLKYIILTHCHGDHIGGVNELKEKKGGQILAHRDESINIKQEDIVLSYIVGIEEQKIDIDARIDDEDIIHIGKIELKIIHTPGHTSGSICIYNEENKLLLSGDTIFYGTWGRTDLPTASLEDIMNSIMNKILVLPDETIIYPGHGKSTMIKDEKHIYYDLK